MNEEVEACLKILDKIGEIEKLIPKLPVGVHYYGVKDSKSRLKNEVLELLKELIWEDFKAKYLIK